MAARQIVVEFLGSDKSLSSTAKDATSTTSRLGDTLKKVGKVAAVGLAAGVVVAGKALVGMTQGAIEDEAAQVKLANTLKNAAGATDEQVAATEKWITAQGTSLGVTDDELRPALQRLTEATGDVGKAQDLASLAMDVSAGTGKSLKTVSEALMKAQNGQVSGLSRLGIETKNAAGETLTFEQATKKMADTFGGQAQQNAETLDGKMRRLKIIMSEAGEEIGAKLIPVVTKMAEWFLNKGLPAIQAFGGWMRDDLFPIIGRIREVFNRVLGALSGDVDGRLGAVRDIIRNAVTIIRELWDRFGDRIVDVLRSAFDIIKSVVRNGLQIVSGIFEVISGVLRGDWDQVWDGIKNIVRGAWDIIKDVVRNGWEIVRTIFRAAGDVIRDVMRNVWDAIKDVVGNGWDAIRESVRNGWDNIKEAFRSAGGVLMDVMRNVWETLKEAVRNGWDTIKEVFRASGGAMVDIMRNVWSGARDIIGDGISSIVDMIRSVPDRIRSLVGGFGNVGEALIGALVNGMKNAGGVVAGIAGNVWSAVRGMLNSAISQINAALEFRIDLPGPDITINPPNIPYLAKGGIVTKPTLALIGEAGPEAVVPLTGSYARNAGMSSAAPSEENITVVLQLDGREIHRSLVKRKRTLGTTLGLA